MGGCLGLIGMEFGSPLLRLPLSLFLRLRDSIFPSLPPPPPFSESKRKREGRSHVCYCCCLFGCLPAWALFRCWFGGMKRSKRSYMTYGRGGSHFFLPFSQLFSYLVHEKVRRGRRRRRRRKEVF